MSPQTPERRQHCRIAFRAPAELVLDGSALAALVIDLSLKGALVELAADTTLALAAACELRVRLDAAGEEIAMRCEVAHLAGRHAGLVCTGIDLDSVTHLRRLVELNLGDPALLERELSALIAD